MNTQSGDGKRSDSSDLSAAGQKVPLDRLTLPQSHPGRDFDTLALEQLTASVKEHGILQPILVRPVGEKYELVTGALRYRAAVEAGLTEVPVTVRVLSDEQAVRCALLENWPRDDLNPVEETERILQLLAIRLECRLADVTPLLYRLDNEAKGKITRNLWGSSQAEIVEQVFAELGRMSWQSFIRTRLPLLKLPPPILEALRFGRIEYTKAQEIAKLESESERMALLSKTISQSLSLREVKKLVRAKKAPGEPVELQALMADISKRVRKFPAWEDSDKRGRLESLLAEMQALLSEEE